VDFWITILFPLLNFLILLLLLWVLARKPVRIFLAGRAERFKKRLKASRAKLLRSEAHLQESEARRILYDQQRHNLTRSMVEYGRRESEHILQEAQDRVDAMRLDARRQAAHELAKLKRSLYRETVLASIERAKERICERLNVRESAELAKRSVDVIAEGVGK
jgi:F0F1-type ATP synthase membrane subunit b/b'